MCYASFKRPSLDILPELGCKAKKEAFSFLASNKLDRDHAACFRVSIAIHLKVYLPPSYRAKVCLGAFYTLTVSTESV